MDLRTEILTKLPVRKKVTPSGWLTINCPMCTSQGQSRNDTKSRGGFAFKDGLSYHCFNCNYKASYQTGRLLNKKMRMLLIKLFMVNMIVMIIVLFLIMFIIMFIIMY